MLARNYRGDHKWTPAKVKERTGPLSYTVEIAPDTIWRRHIDQLESVPSSAPFTTTDTVSSGSDTTTLQDGTVSSSDVPQALTPTCVEKRYPTRVRKPPTRLDL